MLRNLLETVDLGSIVLAFGSTLFLWLLVGGEWLAIPPGQPPVSMKIDVSVAVGCTIACLVAVLNRLAAVLLLWCVTIVNTILYLKFSPPSATWRTRLGYSSIEVFILILLHTTAFCRYAMGRRKTVSAGHIGKKCDG